MDARGGTRAGPRPEGPRTLAEAVESLDRDDQGLTFVENGEEKFLGFATLNRSSAELGAKLAGLGLRKGDRAVMVVASQYEFIQLFLGAVRAGVVPVPLYPPFVLGELDAYLAGLDRILRITDARVLLTSAPIIPFLEQLESDVRRLTFDDVEASEEQGDLVAVGPDDLAFLQFTSGSTAAPKGVMVPHRTLIENATKIGAHLGISPERDRGVSWLPLYHDFGLIGFTVTPMLRQTSIWYLAPLDFARDPTSWPELIHRVGGTAGSAPNFGYELVARRATEEQLERWDLSGWRIAACGAETIRPETLERFARKFEPAGFSRRAFLPCYGLAEATLAISLWPVEEPPRTVTIDAEALRERGQAVLDDAPEAVEVMSCGPPLPDHEVAILDPQGNPLPELHEGEIAFRGPSVTDGYFENAEATAAVFEGGWLRTGDLGFLHEGEVIPTSRKKDLIVVSGRNYHPHDVEWCAGEDAGVRGGGAIAFAVAGAIGEAAVLVVEARPEVDHEELRRRLASRVRSRLGLTLKEVVVVGRGELPKTSSGKPRRAELRGRYENGELTPASGVAA
jgi:fatty-acyl-CoA synthase